MNIPIPNTDQFLYTPPKPDPGGIDRFIGNIAALQDPSGTLERLQVEEVAKATADVKMEDIDAQYKQLALKTLQDYQNNRLQMYKSNKGFNRLKLTGEQILQDQLAYKRMLMDINMLKQTSNENAQTMQDVYKMYASQVLTPKEYGEFEKRRQEADAKATDIGSVPRYRNILNNYLQTKPQRITSDPNKWTYKAPEQFADAMNKMQLGQTAYNDGTGVKQLGFVFGSPIWANEIRPMMQKFGIIPPGDDPVKEAEAVFNYVKSRFNPKEGRSGGTTVYNNYGVKNPVKVDWVQDDNGDIVWNFPKRDISYEHESIPGFLTGVVNKNGKWYGEFSVDKMIPGNIANAKTTFGAKNQTAVKDRFNNEVYLVELDASDYSKVRAAGYNLDEGDKYNWDNLQTQRNRTTKQKPVGVPNTSTTTVLPGYENVWPAGRNNARYIYNGYPYSYEEISQELEANGGSVSVAISNGTVTVELPKK